jgi:SAM-dependent MidA family methyltransferase
MSLPAPDSDALAYSQALKIRIANEIAASDGWIGFERFMELALYAPGMGYYSGGARKFGAAGDFVTAPEISPVFSQTLAAQAKQIMALSAPRIIEVGAGSGRLAADLLLELELQNSLPESYAILDLSGELRQRQRETLMARAPHLLERVTWLDRLPEYFNGLVLANELLDAMPVHLLVWGSTDDPSEIFERGVAFINDEFVWRDRPASSRILERATTIATEHDLPCGYLSEICLSATDWTAAWAGILGHGALLLIDYGFPRHEFYHPQRSSGTLMCHYRHHAHGEPFFLPGLQDITAHVDFTAIVEAGVEAKLEAGLDFLGYTSQAAFLLNCGITGIISRLQPEETMPYLAQAQAVQKLISPAEMGELFKVIALGKGIKETLIGFTHGERGATL